MSALALSPQMTGEDIREDLCRVGPEFMRDSNKFKRINPALSGLVVRDKGLRLSQLSGKFGLGQSSSRSGCSERLPYSFVLLLLDPHRSALRAGRSGGGN